MRKIFLASRVGYRQSSTYLLQICVTGDSKEPASGFLNLVSTRSGYLGLFGHSIVSVLVCPWLNLICWLTDANLSG